MKAKNRSRPSAYCTIYEKRSQQEANEEALLHPRGTDYFETGVKRFITELKNRQRGTSISSNCIEFVENELRRLEYKPDEEDDSPPSCFSTFNLHISQEQLMVPALPAILDFHPIVKLK